MTSIPCVLALLLQAGPPELPLVRDPSIVGVGGASWLDYDADGWPDLFSNYSGQLYRNLEGQNFALAADLDAIQPPIPFRYNASCADYDADGDPDIACEPRGNCFTLLQNLGGGAFVEVASDPAIVLDPPECGMYAETYCWADVDEDGDVDLWAPAYPDLPGSGGNHFFQNLGPTGPGGEHRFQHRLDTLAILVLARPEGAQFVDYDRDGDVDGFANRTCYANVSKTGAPSFLPLLPHELGILRWSSEEGVVFFDYDLDGDEDFLAMTSPTRLHENRGDGTFAPTSGVLERPMEGEGTGCSAEDWDADGDVDLSTVSVFRRNMRVEEGVRLLRIVPDDFPNQTAWTPAWADWDRDGDMDCAMAAWGAGGLPYRNVTYGVDTPATSKLTVRVRPVGDSPTVARGLESEFGATVELRPHGDASGFVRRRFAASSHGYLQQSEYALTMALPPGPDAAAPALGVLFDLVVDFPSLPENGFLRIDRTINPALGGIELGALADREITVWRSGKARIDGVEHLARSRFAPRLRSTGALALPDESGVPIEPLTAPAPLWFVGMELETRGARGPIRVAELVLDGQLEATSGRCGANVQLWDVTPGVAPRVVRVETHATSPRNRRSFLAVDWTLAPDRLYRVLCRVTELRASPRVPLPAGAALNVRGALSFASPGPCAPLDAVVVADPAVAYLELRYRTSVVPETR